MDTRVAYGILTLSVLATMNSGEFRGVVLGGGGVGKSALTIQFVKSHFVLEYDPTIEDSYRKQIRVDDTTAVIDILDTAGQEEYSAMREQWLRYGEGFLVVYSITSRKSFDELIPLQEQLKRVRDVDSLNEVPTTVFGNKLDLANDRQVPKDEGMSLAQRIGASFFEGSAKEGTNVEEAFFQLVRLIRDFRVRLGGNGERGGSGGRGSRASRRGGCQIL
eukprot:TRINITY_DN13208_c0_g1_i1.p1 TRINITY_DN13208_c0_g1~~TRINITY_DN13208_c0_g1_i1.p1  ORF type:complete len:219 (-),score=50.87 TRINITY_DN13208_c0_g1_i1:76-732(-)